MHRRAMLARLQVEDGREHEAAAALPRMVADLPTVRHFAFWLPCAVLLAEVAFAVGDAGAAGTLYEQLLPFAACNVSLGAGVLSRGVVAERLGLLATVTGAVDQAIVHFEDALRRNARNGALPALARTQIAYAQVLLEHGDPSARDRAQQLLADGLVTARRLGMAGRVGKALARRDGAGGAVVTLRVQVEDDRLWEAVKREGAAGGSRCGPSGRSCCWCSATSAARPRSGPARAAGAEAWHTRACGRPAHVLDTERRRG
jgi:ATP/maltotriose-dependent transcriptional regulator MalT